MKFKLSRALSSCAPYWTIQGLHPSGSWHDLYQYQDTPHGALQAKAALNQLILDDGPGVGHYEDFRLLEPVPEKVRKKARRLVLERRKEASGPQPPPEPQQGSRRRSGRSGGTKKKARRG